MILPFRFLLLFLLLSSTALTISAESKASKATTQLLYSFSKAPFINPRIVQDLTTWLSDKGDQVMSINLDESQNSNRYFAQTKVRAIKNQAPFVYIENKTVESGETNVTTFGYRFIGKTTAGIYVLECVDNPGGSGSFRSLMLVKLETEAGIDVDWKMGVIGRGERRTTLKKLGQIALGDRWDGSLKVVGDSIEIGTDVGPLAETEMRGKSSQIPKTKKLKLLLDAP